MGGHYAEKSLNENLQPLVRFLRSQVGRPWSKVSSEIHAQVHGGSAVQLHILQHLADFVELHVRDVSGVLYGSGRWGGPRPLHASCGSRDRFYVCPKSGLLRRVVRRSRKHESKAQDPRFRKVHETLYWMKRPGGWFEVALEPLPLWNEPSASKIDALTHAQVRTTAHRAKVHAWECPWWRTHFVVRVRQVGKKELRAAFE